MWRTVLFHYLRLNQFSWMHAVVGNAAMTNDAIPSSSLVKPIRRHTESIALIACIQRWMVWQWTWHVRLRPIYRHITTINAMTGQELICMPNSTIASFFFLIFVGTYFCRAPPRKKDPHRAPPSEELLPVNNIWKRRWICCLIQKLKSTLKLFASRSNFVYA